MIPRSIHQGHQMFPLVSDVGSVPHDLRSVPQDPRSEPKGPRSVPHGPGSVPLGFQRCSQGPKSVHHGPGSLPVFDIAYAVDLSPAVTRFPEFVDP